MNNLYSFSNPCYLTELLINDSKDICYKKVYRENNSFIFENIDISKIRQDKNDEYIINILSNNMFQFSHLDIYNPVIYNEKIKYSNAKKLKFFDNNYLQIEKDFFLYEHNSDDKLIIDTKMNFYKYNDILLILTENNEKIKTFYNYDRYSFKINIEKKGKYYFEFINLGEDIDEVKIFRCYIFDKIIDEIDFSKNIYFGLYQNLKTENTNNNEILSYYKVSKLKEDKQVYFTFGNIVYDYFNDYKYTGFSFWICNLKNSKCVQNQNSYLFLKGVEYKIYIHLLNSDIYYNLHWEYSFFPILESTTQKIKESGYFNIDSPKIFILEENKDFYFDSFNAIPYFISSDGLILSESDNIPKIYIKEKYLNKINIYSFYLEKDAKYRTIIFVPENNYNQKQIFITNNKSEISDYIKQPKQGNYLFYIYKENSLSNYFETYTSPENNLRFVNIEKNGHNKNRNFIFNNLGNKYLYIDKSDKDIYISRYLYQPKYLIFTILNDETFYYFNSFLISNNININSRLNTDQILINDLFNIYIDKFDVKYNLYIKKYYGLVKIYESEYLLNDIKSDMDILTKPINNLINKKSAFNRLIQLSKNQLITGYLSADSLLDIYLEKDNDNKDIYLSDFKNRKYIKKGIEYQIQFYLNHLIKLEPQFNAEVVIYNNDTKIILNNKNQTGIVIGNDFKIITNESAMIYFYPKTKKFQKRIEPKKGEIVEILFKTLTDSDFKYSIDFGFEGYEPPNMHYCFRKEIYIGNIYEKLDINLTQGEYLYIYYNELREDNIKINYIQDGIISSDYKYNLYHYKQNENRKMIYINKSNRTIKLSIKQYSSKSNSLSYKIKMKYNNEIYKISEEIINNIFNKLSFESKNDLIINYLYEDKKDEYFQDNGELIKERKVYQNLFINDIKIINDTFVKINFNPNYKNSLTKYIIIISSEENKKEINNINNDLYLIDLINNKEKDFILEEYYDIGENDFINAIIDITKLKNKYKKFSVNIISQELRFEKGFNFYEPKLFELKNNYIKNFCLIIGLSLLLIMIYLYVRKSYKKINIKKEKLKKFEAELGTELNDSKDFKDN